MIKLVEKIQNIRNIVIKSILAVVGLVCVVAAVYPFVMRSLLLTDITFEWDNTNWILLIGGFILAVAASQYNLIVDAIINKFK